MKTYCSVCKNYTDNSNLRVVKNKQRLLVNQIVRSVEIKKICLLQRGLVYFIV